MEDRTMDQSITKKRAARVSAARRWAFVSAAACLVSTSACADRDGPRMNVYSHRVTTADEAPNAFTCSEVYSVGSASTGGEGGSFWLREASTMEGLEIRWGTGNDELGARFFPVDYFEDHKFTQFLVEAPDGVVYMYAVWGSEKCETCPSEHLDEFQDYPGGVVQCSVSADGADEKENSPDESNDAGAESQSDDGVFLPARSDP